MRVLFLDSVHPILEDRLQKAGFQTQHDYTSTLSELQLETVDGIIIRSRLTIDRSFLEKAIALKFIGRSGSGLENIDLVACAEKGIEVFNSPEGNSTAVAEHLLGMLLVLFNNLLVADKEVRAGLWRREENRGVELEGKTVGLIGYGVMGNATAKRLSGFDCKVIAYDKYKSDYGNQWATACTLKDIFNDADIVSLHVPLTAETKNMVHLDFLKSFKKPIVLVNTSRGGVVALRDLLTAMNENLVVGACLDVLEYEESSFEKINLDHDVFHALKEKKNIVFSPHVAGWTKESYIKLSSVLADKILDRFKI